MALKGRLMADAKRQGITVSELLLKPWVEPATEAPRGEGRAPEHSPHEQRVRELARTLPRSTAERIARTEGLEP